MLISVNFVKFHAKKIRPIFFDQISTPPFPSKENRTRPLFYGAIKISLRKIFSRCRRFCLSVFAGLLNWTEWLRKSSHFYCRWSLSKKEISPKVWVGWKRVWFYWARDELKPSWQLELALRLTVDLSFLIVQSWDLVKLMPFKPDILAEHWLVLPIVTTSCTIIYI